MNNLDVLSATDAPEASQPLLAKSLKAFGVIPNLHAVMAVSPSVLDAYQQLHHLFQNSSFNNEELTVIWQTINVESECHYCIPAHTFIAHNMKVAPSLNDALRNRTAMPTEKLQALHETTLKVIRQRGKVSNSDVDTFYKAGYGPQQLAEIVLGIAQKVLSNYINHLANTPIDNMMKDFV